MLAESFQLKKLMHVDFISFDVDSEAMLDVGRSDGSCFLSLATPCLSKFAWHWVGKEVCSSF